MSSKIRANLSQESNFNDLRLRTSQTNRNM